MIKKDGVLVVDKAHEPAEARVATKLAHCRPMIGQQRMMRQGGLP